jgi:hypothetical protein
VQRKNTVGENMKKQVSGVRCQVLGILGFTKTYHLSPITLFLLFTLYSLLFTFPFAQLATGTNPEQVADDAVRAWLATPQTSLITLSGRSPEEVCEELPGLLVNPAPPTGSSVNFANRQEQTTGDPNIKRYTYPATLPVALFGRDAGERLEVVSVTLNKTGNTWNAERISYQSLSQPSGLRQWLLTPTANTLFIAFSLYVLYLLLRPASYLRQWLRQGVAVIRGYRGIVIGTIVALTLIFGLGMATGRSLPANCQTAIGEILQTALSTLGATQAYGSENLATAATLTFYQNFGVVSLSLLFGLGLFFGFPAYLVSAVQFFTLGIPFGFMAGGSFGQIIFLIILLLLELTSYFLIVAGGGILLVTVVRKGFKGFGEGVRNLALMLPFAMLFLLLGAWYEAVIVILLR